MVEGRYDEKKISLKCTDTPSAEVSAKMLVKISK